MISSIFQIIFTGCLKTYAIQTSPATCRYIDESTKTSKTLSDRTAVEKQMSIVDNNKAPANLSLLTGQARACATCECYR